MKYRVDLHMGEGEADGWDISGTVEQVPIESDSGADIFHFLDGVNRQALEAKVLQDFSTGPVEGVLQALKEMVNARS